MKRLIFMVLICLVAVKGYAVEEVAHYYMDDALADTVVIDNGSGATNGTLAGGETTAGVSVTGKIKTAFALDGNDYVDTNQTLQTTFDSNFSMSMWVKPDDGQPATEEFFTGAYNATLEDFLQLILSVGGAVTYNYKSNAGALGTVSAAGVFPNGATSWTHIVAIAEQTSGANSTLSVYVNGTLAATGGAFAGVMADYVTDKNLYVGARNAAGAAGGFFIGTVDDFRVLPSALTAGEVSAIYEGGRGNQGSLNHPAPSIGISCGATVGSS